jgi:lysyl-tRNA synthetase class 2
MSSFEEIRSARHHKLHLLEDIFGNAYPAHSSQTHTIADAISKFPQLLKSKKSFTVAGRIRALRPHGGSIFFDLEDDGTIFQGFIRKEDIPEKIFSAFSDALDVGDFIEVSGHAYITKRKERSILVTNWHPLAKSLRPLPEKWHGLQDVEERYRHRALDVLSNPRTREIFVTRAKLITTIRTYLDTLNFLEVETPMLQPIPGGTTARPFRTHHNALDTDLYLRIAPELYLKRLLVAGYPKIYELARNFRNEGIDVTHNPEFTMLEAYIAYMDYEGLMKFIEGMMKSVIRTVTKKKFLEYQGKKIDFSKPFKKLSFYDSIKQYALLPGIESIKHDELIIAAKRFGIDVSTNPETSALMEDIFRKTVRQHLIQPTFVIDHPIELLPLAKRSTQNPKTVQSFQLYVGGIELVKAFSELNDPIDQRARFEAQEELRKSGDEEAQRIDEDFIENLEYGMPPSAGFGVGIDRLMLLLTDTHNLREIILFPTLKPR